MSRRAQRLQHVLVFVGLHSEREGIAGPAAPETAGILTQFVRQTVSGLNRAVMEPAETMAPGVFVVSFRAAGVVTGRQLAKALDGSVLTLTCGKQFVVTCRQVRARGVF